ncbi:hypothetical protein BAFK78_H013 (plasmid) [Borreliella afzelii K78]|nr:hypothetical protein BAFK78_H013 [Borreliella afzelii K78]
MGGSPRYLLKSCKSRTLVYFLILGEDNYEQDSSKEKINKRLDNYNFKNEKDRSPFLPMLHKLEVV